MELMAWYDYLVEKELLKRNKKKFVCHGMWTPSGYFHIGNARAEIFTPYAVRHALESKGKKVVQNLIIDDFDAIRKIPGNPFIPKKDYDKYLGFPCALAPSPLPGFNSWSEAFSSNIKDYIKEFGVKLKIISAYKTYKKGKFNKLIKESLEKSKQIIGFWNKIAGTKKPETFIPLQVLCEKCNRIHFTQATEWDGKQVKYNCLKCGFSNKVSPFNGKAKLHWRVHWVAHWVLYNVDFESGGKDHFSKGGSVDVGRTLIRKVFHKEPPVQVPTEFIQLKGEKMSGSKGNVIGLKEWLDIASPELLRFINFSYNSKKAIEISLRDNSFILLNEQFERAKKIFLGKEKAQSPKLTKKIARNYELAIIDRKAHGLIIPFSTGLMLAQLYDLEKEFSVILKKLRQQKIIGKLNKKEKNALKKQLIRAKNWVQKYAPNKVKIKIVENPLKIVLEEKQKIVLKNILRKLKESNEDIKQTIFTECKKNNLKPKKVFQIIYLALFNQKFGPQIDTLEKAIGRKKIVSQLNKIL